MSLGVEEISLQSVTKNLPQSAFKQVSLWHCSSSSYPQKSTVSSTYITLILLPKLWAVLVCFVTNWFPFLCACSVTSRVWLFCDSADCSPPGSSLQGIPKARIVDRVIISSSIILYSSGLFVRLLYLVTLFLSASKEVLVLFLSFWQLSYFYHIYWLWKKLTIGRLQAIYVEHTFHTWIYILFYTRRSHHY